jgi:hypothetical protein
MYSTLQHVRTVGIFLDSPIYLETLLSNMPLLSKGIEIEFDDMVANHIKVVRQYEISGVYVVESVSLKYGSKHSGLTQYVRFRK